MKPIISTFKTAIITAGKRALQLVGFGQMAAVAEEYAPWGVDSSPLPNTEALYVYTSNRNRQAVAGYRNTKQLAATGETRIYGTDTSGNVVCNIWLRNDANILIGVSLSPGDYYRHFVRFEDLEERLGAFKDEINNKIVQVFNDHIHIVPGSENTGTPLTQTTNVALDISSAKAPNILIQ